PSCGARIRARDNLPIVGWLLRRGRCHDCRAPISLRYPLVELGSALLALAVYARFVAGEAGDPVALPGRFLVYFAFVGTLVVISGIDLEHQLVPDTVTYPAVPAFFVCGLLLQDVRPFDLVLGMVIGYGMVAVVAELAALILKREGMGYG